MAFSPQGDTASEEVKPAGLQYGVGGSAPVKDLASLVKEGAIWLKDLLRWLKDLVSLLAHEAFQAAAPLPQSSTRRTQRPQVRLHKPGLLQPKSPFLATVMTALVFTLPSFAAAQTLDEAISKDAKLDYFFCSVLLSWWAGTWVLLRICEILWQYDWYCKLLRLKFIGGLCICGSAVIAFLTVVFWNGGSASTPESSGPQTPGPQISASLSTFLVWLVGGGCGVWISGATMRHACALTKELATPRYRIAYRTFFQNQTAELLAKVGKSSELQVVKAYLPVSYSLSGWSPSVPQWWAQQYQYYWNGRVFWDCSTAEVYVIMRSVEERLGMDSVLTVSTNVLHSNALGVARARVHAMLARLPNCVWQAQVCREIVNMLLEDEDVRAGVRSNNGELCGVKLAGGVVPFEDEDAFLANSRTLASVGLLALWEGEDKKCFVKLQRFVEDMYPALPTAVVKWQEGELTDKVRELALEILGKIKEAKMGRTLVDVAAT